MKTDEENLSGGAKQNSTNLSSRRHFIGTAAGGLAGALAMNALAQEKNVPVNSKSEPLIKDMKNPVD
jgi:hypothetical protein